MECNKKRSLETKKLAKKKLREFEHRLKCKLYIYKCDCWYWHYSTKEKWKLEHFRNKKKYMYIQLTNKVVEDIQEQTGKGHGRAKSFAKSLFHLFLDCEDTWNLHKDREVHKIWNYLTDGVHRFEFTLGDTGYILHSYKKLW